MCSKFFLTLFLILSSSALACDVYQVEVTTTATTQNCYQGSSPFLLSPKVIVGSYNLHWLRNPKGLKSDLEHLNFVQIWAFQEVLQEHTTNALPQSLLQILPAGTWYIAYVPLNSEKNQNYKMEGQAIASRFPFSDFQIRPLQHSGLKNRAAYTAKFSLGNQRSFWFLNTDHEVEVFQLGFSDRLKQLKSLIDILNSFPKNDGAVVLGDFNTAGDQRFNHFMSSPQEVQQTYAFMKSQNLKWPSLIPQKEVTFKNIWTQNHLDHIFLKNLEPTSWNKYSQRKGSDHYPIFTEIVF